MAKTRSKQPIYHPTHEYPSAMGGSFQVCIVEDLPGAAVRVRVIYPSKIGTATNFWLTGRNSVCASQPFERQAVWTATLSATFATCGRPSAPPNPNNTRYGMEEDMNVFESPTAHDVTRIEAESRSFICGNRCVATIDLIIANRRGSEPITIYGDDSMADKFEALAKAVNEIFAEPATVALDCERSATDQPALKLGDFATPSRRPAVAAAQVL